MRRRGLLAGQIGGDAAAAARGMGDHVVIRVGGIVFDGGGGRRVVEAEGDAVFVAVEGRGDGLGLGLFHRRREIGVGGVGRALVVGGGGVVGLRHRK